MGGEGVVKRTWRGGRQKEMRGRKRARGREEWYMKYNEMEIGWLL